MSPSPTGFGLIYSPFETRKHAMPLPSLRGTDHIGFTVPNLDEAHDFFTRIIGCDLIYSLGPFESEGDWMLEHLNVHPRTVMRRLNFYRCKNGSNFEVFEYEPHDPPQGQPLNSDIGGHHLGFYVDDLDEAIEYLRSEGIRVLGDATASSSHSTGQRWVYFLSPWGMQFELVSYPNGKRYENEHPPVKLWDPRNPNL